MNESDLHRSLKNDYAERFHGSTEQEVAGKVCDILTPAGEVIEIQTANLAQIAPKVARLVDTHPFRLVYPLVTEKIIETYDADGSPPGRLLSARKSPKRLTIFAIFRELTSLYPWLDHPNFSLEVVRVKVAEERVRTSVPVQLGNRSRHFKKPWYKQGKRLLERGETRVFANAADYGALLPPLLGDTFTVKEVKQAGAGSYASYMLWVLEKLGVVEFTGKRGNSKVFRRS
jgi:hypothetical protein